MAVYVDNMRAPFGRLVLCHMIADSTAELNQMVDWLGVQRKWIQDAGTWREHYDISRAKRKLAVDLYGAKELTQRELVLRIMARRNNAQSNADGRGMVACRLCALSEGSGGAE